MSSLLGQGGETPTPQPSATAPAATPVPQVPLVAQEFTLSSLNIRDGVLVSPISATQFNLRVPVTWEFEDTSVLNLHLEFFKTGEGSENDVVDVQVLIDNSLVSTLTIPRGLKGSQTFSVPLSKTILNDPIRRVHTVQLALNARTICISNHELQVLIRSNMSYVRYEYRETAPVRNLAQLPLPFYTSPLGGVTEKATIVTSAAPTAEDMQSILGVVAGLGRQTDGELVLDAVSIDQLTDTLASENLIYVGRTGQHAGIDDLYRQGLLPTKRDDSGAISVRDQVIGDDDGTLQLIENPKNPLRSILVVTGKSDLGLSKAARALSATPALVGAVSGSLAIISDVRIPAARPYQDRVTFAQLGYNQIQIYGIGTRNFDVLFQVPQGTVLSEESFIELEFDISDTLRTSQTSVSLILNGTPLQSAFVGEIASTESGPTATPDSAVKRIRAAIPPTSVQLGLRNTLSIVLDVQGDWKCYPPSDTVAWLSVRPTSSITIPRLQATTGLVTPNLSTFPVPYIGQRDLSGTLVMLGEKPNLNEIKQAIDVFNRLGAQTPDGVAFAPRVVFGKAPDSVLISNHDLIIIGRPSSNAFLTQINNYLPQPFIEGTDDLKQVIDSITYRLPPGYDIGVLQALRSPWAEDKTVLVITGIGPDGLIKATNALLSFDYSNEERDGNVIFAAANTISAVNTTDTENYDGMQTEVPLLVTRSAELGTPVPTLSSAQTVTPGPTFTPTVRVTLTPTSASQTIVATSTVQTALPTFAPLGSQDVQPVPIEQPTWIAGLAILTLVVVALTLLFGTVRLLRGAGRKKS